MAVHYCAPKDRTRVHEVRRGLCAIYSITRRRCWQDSGSVLFVPEEGVEKVGSVLFILEEGVENSGIRCLL